jgi:hypothetical protein
MMRALVAFAFLGWLSASSALAQFGGYMEGQISLTTRENGDLQSAADVTCFTYFGAENLNCLLKGEHYIYNTITGDQLTYRYYETIHQYSGSVRRAPFEDDCYRARVTGEIFGAPLQYWGSTMTCRQRPEPIDDHPGCPILLDLDDDGFHLTGLEDAVEFDLNADGVPEELTWTAAGERDAFLCRDLNHNGVIDNGEEIFSHVTPLSTGERAQIAFTALAELDQPELGGNFDGTIGAEDAAFEDLCVWIDENHDGTSQPGEITSLEVARVTRLEYDYTVSRQHDEHGNLYRYKSRAWALNSRGRERVIKAYDVFFLEP